VRKFTKYSFVYEVRLISFKFGAEFHQVTPDVLETFNVKCRRSRL